MTRFQFLGVLAVAVLGTSAVSDDKKPRVLGPEWVPYEVKHPLDPDGPPQKGHQRPITVTQSRPLNFGYTSGGYPLENGTLSVQEHDGGGKLHLHVVRKGELTIGDKLDYSAELDTKGKPTYHSVSFGPITYIDLDGDGVIDCWLAPKNGRTTSWIMLDGKQVEVDTGRALFQKHLGLWANKIEGEGGYVFEKGKWRER